MRLSEARVVLTGCRQRRRPRHRVGPVRQWRTGVNGGRHRESLEPLHPRYPQHLCWVGAGLTFLADRRKVLAAAEAIGGINPLINALEVNHFAMLEQLDDNETSPDAGSQHQRAHLPDQTLAAAQQADSAMVVNVGSTYGSIRVPRLRQLLRHQVALRGCNPASKTADTRVGVLYVAPRATRTTMNSPAARGAR